ncbi:Putative transposase of IS4/5 family [Cohaesibacter sp. ES.047]|nr:Putative transposase of IS4/5 family [Cohaesibacter sp. ES.047]
MPWDNTARVQHNRDKLRYPTDLADKEWEVIALLLPPARSGGRPRTTNMRDVIDAILYAGGRGCVHCPRGATCNSRDLTHLICENPRNRLKDLHYAAH